jgi:DNA-binding CsgD family transcriptional regulator/tetratricopeptide (TPR) repeat protein
VEWYSAVYQPVAEVIRAALARVPGPPDGILSVILPELGPSPPDVSLPAVASAVCAVLADAVSASTVVADAGPASTGPAGTGGLAVVFIDDLQWADQATLDLLPALADAARGKPVLLVACYRNDELPRHHRLRPVRAELRRRQQLAEISLEPLDAAAVRAMLAALLGAEPECGLAAAVADRADGIPFAVQELAFALRDTGRLTYHDSAAPADTAASHDQTVTPGAAAGTAERAGGAGQMVGLAGSAGTEAAAVPDGVREAVLLRTGRLPPAERSLLEAAAVTGPEFDVDVAAELAGLPAWSDLLAGTGLVTEAVGSWAAFRHALTRDAIYADIPWSRRRDLHRQLAGRLAAASGSHGLVAAHLLAARDLDEAREALLTEAAEHQAVHAYRDAARALRGARDIWPSGGPEAQRLRAVAELAHCAEMCAEHAEAIALRRELADSCQRAGDQAGLAAANRRLALAHEMLGQWDAALAAREMAASAFAAAGNRAEAAAERLAAAAHLRSAAAFSAALDLLVTARADAEAAGRTDLMLRIDGHRGNVLARLGRSAEGIGAIREALDRALARVPGDSLTDAAAELQQRLADALEHAGDYQAATAAYASAYQFCDAHGDMATGQLCRACVTVVMFTHGQWNRAAGICADVLDSAASPAHARAVSSGMLGLILAWRGDAVRARPLLLASRSIATRIELAAMELLSGWGLCVLDDAAGSYSAAADRAQLILGRWQRTEERHYAIPILQWMSAFFAEHDAGAQVRACAVALSRIAELTAQPEALAALAHALGETTRLDAGPGAAAAEFLRSVELFGPLGLPLATATAQRRAAAILLQAGDPQRGVRLLSAAYQAADRLDAGPLRAQLRTTLAGLGVKPPERRGAVGRDRAGLVAAAARSAAGSSPAGSSPAGSSPAGLSAREAEVMRLVAAGNTSREIGGQLFLSPRTVEMHVRSSMLKLDCRTRAAAVRRITELGLMEEPAGDRAR